MAVTVAGGSGTLCAFVYPDLKKSSGTRRNAVVVAMAKREAAPVRKVHTTVGDMPQMLNCERLRGNINVPIGLSIMSELCDKHGCLHVKFQKELSVQEFEEFMRLNQNLEVDHDGSLVVLNICSPLSDEVGGELYFQLKQWNRVHRNNAGVIFTSRVGFVLTTLGLSHKGSAKFKLPYVAAFYDKKVYYEEMARASDALVIGAPEFFIEVATDPFDLTVDRSEVKNSSLEKMELFGREGAKLGYIFDYKNKEVWKYHYAAPGFDAKQPLRLKDPKTGDVTGENVLPAFVVDFEALKATGWW
eukprot:TRINITY_DN1504_c0_g1_i1.p1 TRINITY_DN1504_c0_g1~~TRINITY_DN1504_c0_g1_i1.p1  ORF type:complete len:301 (-),score=64.01 TRINITY_DN1504_c0_g1_i1:459-1361(-)